MPLIREDGTVEHTFSEETLSGIMVDFGFGETTSGVGGSTTFIDLTDTPGSYAGNAGRVVQVTPGETAIEFGPNVSNELSGISSIVSSNQNMITDVGDIVSGINIHGYASNANMKYESISGVSIGDDIPGVFSVMRDTTNSNTIVWQGKVFVDFLVSGAGGLDVGVYTAGSWYAIFVIGDSTGALSPMGLASLSQTSPTLPAGYNVFRRVGWVRADPTTIRKFIQEGRDRCKRYYWDADAAANLVLAFGTATVFTAVSAATAMPPTSLHAKANTLYTNTVAGNKFWGYRPTGSTVATPSIFAPGNPTAVGEFYIIETDIFTNKDQSFDYANFGAGAGVSTVTTYITSFFSTLE